MREALQTPRVRLVVVNVEQPRASDRALAAMPPAVAESDTYENIAYRRDTRNVSCRTTSVAGGKRAAAHFTAAR
jgi:hypothetical protein